MSNQRGTTGKGSNGTKRPYSCQSKYWIVTYNNPTETINAIAERLGEKGAKYTMQMERGKQGTKHLQAFIWMDTRCRRTGITKLFGDNANPHIEAAKRPKDAERYCRKEETREGEYLTNIKEEEINLFGQGSRSDLAEACNRILSGAKIQAIATEHPTSYVKYSRGFHQLSFAVSIPRDTKTTVLWMCGETGWGKSRFARQIQRSALDNAWSCYSKSGSTKWFDGYCGDELVIWDELDKDFPFTLLLQLLDRYELKVETKGGYVNFNAKLIIITTNYSPREIFTSTEEKHLCALERRINHYLQLDGPAFQDLE